MNDQAISSSSRLRRWLRREDGWAGTPFMVIGLVLLLVTAIQSFLWFAGWNIAQSAAQSAYSLARSHEAAPGVGENMAYQFLESMGGSLESPHVEITRSAETVTVTVSGTVLSILPGLTLPEVSATVVGPIERWVPAP